MPNVVPMTYNAANLARHNISIPMGRAGHAMTLIGNPLEYIMVFGGASVQNITSTENMDTVIKQTLNDLWVFYIGDSTWSQIFVNSDMNPEPRELSSLVTVKADRLVLLYGG